MDAKSSNILRVFSKLENDIAIVEVLSSNTLISVVSIKGCSLLLRLRRIYI
jgi:hypothetical protein